MLCGFVMLFHRFSIAAHIHVRFYLGRSWPRPLGLGWILAVLLVGGGGFLSSSFVFRFVGACGRRYCGGVYSPVLVALAWSKGAGRHCKPESSPLGTTSMGTDDLKMLPSKENLGILRKGYPNSEDSFVVPSQTFPASLNVCIQQRQNVPLIRFTRISCRNASEG